MNAAPSIVGQWIWVRSYNVGFEPSSVDFHKGTIFNFNSNNDWTRSLNSVVIDSGTYALFLATTLAEDSINFYRSTPPPSFPTLDSSYAYYAIQGDSLRIGALNPVSDPRVWLYGIVDVYARH